MENKTMENVKVIEFEHCGTFNFTVFEELNKNRDKKIYIGKFESNRNEGAPENCECDKLYCMKKAKIVFPNDDFKHPQERHYWDFFSFEGENIREILAMNTGAIQFNQDIQSGKLDVFNNNNGAEAIYDCITIEPCYENFNLNDFSSVSEKIDCMKQIVAGLKQLMGSELFVNAHVTAHRDLKIRNVMVEKKENGEKVLRLIDFPSIKTEFDNASEVDPNRTVEGAFSYSNTTPEDVLEEYQVTEKNDVFVLGCILLELFGVYSYETIRNPLHIMFKMSNLDIRKKDECANFYKKMQSDYSFEDATKVNWLENFLVENNVYPNWDNIDACKNQIRALFRASTAINPDDRISLDEFEKELNVIKSSLPANSQSKPQGLKKTLFLIDVKDFKLHKDVYISKMTEFMKGKWLDIEPVIVGYGWADGNPVLQPTEELVAITEDPIRYSTDMISVIEKLPASKGSDKSRLKGCLYEAIKYMKGTNCTSDIHIFTPIPPTENNMCAFQRAEKTELYSTEIRSLTAREIISEYEGLEVFVYTYRGAIDSWYKPEFFADSYNYTTEEVEKTEVKNEPVKKTQQTPQNTNKEKKTRGGILIFGANTTDNNN